MKLKIVNVVGARPNFMKMAPLMMEYRRHSDRFEPKLVHTGQHYDDNMSTLFFEQLHLPKPDVYLGIGSGSHSEQTAKGCLADPTNSSLRRALIALAIATGFFSIWMTIFVAEPDIRNLLIDAFPGTRKVDALTRIQRSQCLPHQIQTNLVKAERLRPADACAACTRGTIQSGIKWIRLQLAQGYRDSSHARSGRDICGLYSCGGYPLLRKEVTQQEGPHRIGNARRRYFSHLEKQNRRDELNAAARRVAIAVEARSFQDEPLEVHLSLQDSSVRLTLIDMWMRTARFTERAPASCENLTTT